MCSTMQSIFQKHHQTSVILFYTKFNDQNVLEKDKTSFQKIKFFYSLNLIVRSNL